MIGSSSSKRKTAIISVGVLSVENNNSQIKILDTDNIG
jgi:hypothetical protein